MTQSVIYVHGPRSNPIQLASFAEGATVRLRGRSADVFLTVSHWFRVASSSRRNWNAESIGYRYTFRDDGEHEIVSYQWHPNRRSHVTWPHLHAPILIGGRAQPGLHFPTQFVPFASVVRFAIEELGVRPRRADWREVLESGGAR